MTDFQHVASVVDLGSFLVAARLEAGITQEALGNMIGQHRNVIQRYERVWYRTAKISRILEIADALGVQVYLL